MSKGYKPLHQKYRPERFDALVGQKSIANTLKQALLTNRIAPAYLFSGPRGTGKTSSARILARSLNCLSQDRPTVEPCGKCNLCRAIGLGSALDVIEIDAASNTGVDNIREIIEKSRFAPVQARWKVYVIDECHMLSTAAFNALLKTLEEPPSQVVFILATTDPQRVLPTILSRCQRFDFRRIPLKELIEHLKFISQKEEIAIEENALEIIAKRAHGGLRDAESMLDQLSLLPSPIKLESVWDLIGEIPEEKLLSLTSAFINYEPIEILKICRDLIEKGKEPLSILQGFTSILRDLVIIMRAPEYSNLCNISKSFQKELSTYKNQTSLEQILEWQSQLKGAEYQLKQSMQPRLWLEVLLLGLLSKKNYPNIQETQNKTEIERKLKNYSAQSISKTDAPKEVKNTIKVKIKERNTLKEDSNEEGNKSKLSESWEQILASLELPSTRMLLSQQATLVRLTETIAEISVTSNWSTMIQSRKPIIEQAIKKALGKERELIISNRTDSPQNNQQDIVITDVKRKEYLNNNPINKLESINKDTNHDSNQIKIEDNNLNAQNLADFFNGEIIDTNDNP